MADIAVTSENVRLVQTRNAEVYAFIAGVAITAGQAVYFNTSTGKLAVADASGAGTATARGIALNDASAGQAVDVLKTGMVAGYTLTSQSYDDAVFLSDTEGAIADAAGTVSVTVGRVIGRTDPGVEKLIYVDFSWT